LSSSAPTGTTGWIVDGRRGTETVPGTAAGAATGIAEVVYDVSASLATGFAGAFGGLGGVGSTLPATKYLEKGKRKMENVLSNMTTF